MQNPLSKFVPQLVGEYPRKFQSLFGKGYKPKKQPRQAEASTYRDKKYEKKKKGFTPQSQKKSRWGSGGYGTGEEVKVDEKRKTLGEIKKALLGERSITQD